jgi:hypothetical protein
MQFGENVLERVELLRLSLRVRRRRKPQQSGGKPDGRLAARRNHRLT